MEETTRLVTIVMRPDYTLAEKHRAFGTLVHRFQDMAYGYAYSRLGDRSLAEEAAQEAFVVAWLHLAQLRHPGAFAGWFRRILLSQCARLSRRKQVETVPLEEGIPFTGIDPHALAERRELQRRVWQAIQALPEQERQVTILFYINAYSRTDIAEFLGVSETTVKRNLASARRQLKERILKMVQDNLDEQRPSRDEHFAVRVAAFTQQFSMLIDGGQSIVRSLLFLAQQQQDPRLQEVLTHIRMEVEQGITLSAAMARYPEFFDEPYVQAVAQGERSDLRAMLHHLAVGETVAS